MLGVQIFMSSCDLVAASLGVCGCEGTVGNELEYQICAEEKINQRTNQQETSESKPTRLCRFYTNGTIDVPTLTVIEIEIEVGERLCIGDQVPTIESRERGIDSELQDALSARSGIPIASWSPGGEIEIELPVEFRVEYRTKTVAGELLGREASIRFTPTSYRWQFSDGEYATGSEVEKLFLEPGEITARAFVQISVDYRFAGQDWVAGAFSGEVASNELKISVIEIPRRTLLVQN